MGLAETIQDSFVTESREAIAENVRAMMGRRNVNQTELGKRLGVSQAWVSRRCSGDVAFTTDDLVRAAQALDCDLGELLDGARSRCFSPLTEVPAHFGQMELALGIERELVPV